MAKPGTRGAMLVKKSKDQNKNKKSVRNSEIVYFCFKCKFNSNKETIFDSHMEYIHLMGPDTKQSFEKYLSKSHKDLLYSTLANDSEDDRFSMDKSVSVESCVEELDLSKETVEHVEPLVEPVEPPVKPVASEESVEPIKPVEPVENVVPENEVRRESDIFNFGFLDSPVAGPSHELQSIGSATLRNTLNESIILTPRPDTPKCVENVPRHLFRRTSSGGTRSTPTKKFSLREREEKSFSWGWNKKIKNIEDIGDFKTKYKATERTKDLINKHAKETAEGQ